MSKEIKIDEDSYLMLLNKVLKIKEELRDLALDRYRKADESMETNDHFFMLGKNAATFLRQASDIDSDIAEIAKEIKSIVFKDADNSSPNAVGQTDSQMRAIIDLIKQEEEGPKTIIESLDKPDSTDTENI